MDYRNLLKIAYEKAKESRDPSTQNAALLVDDEGNILISETNRFPDNVDCSTERLERPLKYKFSVDAEHNACCVAAKKGVKTEGLTMVCPWAACSKCAQTIIQCGIKRLITHRQALEKSRAEWRADIDVALQMLEEAGVELIIYDGDIGVENVLMSGQRWNP